MVYLQYLEEMHMSTCCFLGHRTIHENEELRSNLANTIEKLIINDKVDTFLFGSKSRFNDLCYEIVSELKEKYHHIKRVYVRAEFPVIDESYERYLLSRYEDTYFPEKLHHAGKAVYVERNFEMIDNSQYCLVYYDETHAPTGRKSGTKIALEYARKQGKEIFIFSNT